MDKHLERLELVDISEEFYLRTGGVKVFRPKEGRLKNILSIQYPSCPLKHDSGSSEHFCIGSGSDELLGGPILAVTSI